MNRGGRGADPAGSGWTARFQGRVRAGLAAVFRPPPTGAPRPAFPPRSRLVWGALISVAAVGFAMLLLDARAFGYAREMPPSVVAIFQWITDLGLSGWFLFPLGIALILLAMLDLLKWPRFVRDTLVVLAVRLAFLFTAIALPGLVIAIVKRLIGRARPFVEGTDPWAYQWLVWRADHASLPSGHATSAFAVAVAFGAIWPRARPFLWAYAVLIAVSRVIVTAHYPSDVIAGAVCGAVGAFLVRHWFAARRLGFVAEADGSVRPLPMPSWRRIKMVARRLVSA